MTRLFQTSCRGCPHELVPGCRLGKKHNQVRGQQVTQGYCNGKPATGEIALVIVGEGSRLEAVDQTFALSRGFRERSLVLINACHEQVCAATNIASKYGTIWSVTDMGFVENADPLQVVNHAIYKLRCEWMLCLKAGDLLAPEALAVCQELITGHENVVGGFLNEDDPYRILVHKEPFMQIEGHFETPFDQKIRTFENWSKLWFKLPPGLLLSPPTIDMPTSTSKDT